MYNCCFFSPVCRVKRVSTPIFVAHDVSVHGSFIGDATQKNKYWATRGYHGQFLEEYRSDSALKSRIPDTRYNLRYNRFYGTQHAIYNNSFYYQFTGQPHVVKYDLEQHDVIAAVSLPESHHNDSVFLYKGGKSYYDIIADESGLWILYGRERANGSKIHVMKLDQHVMKVQRVWRLNFDVGYYRNAVIVCGVLYLVKDVDGKPTEAVIDATYDFYTDTYGNEENSSKIRLKVPFQRITMLTFYNNPADRRFSFLLGWDNGNLIKYPILF